MNGSHLLYKQQIENLDSSVRLIIVHPDYGQQHLIFGDLIHSDVVYIRFEGEALAVAAIEQQFEEALQTQLSNSKLSKSQTIILDECDRVLPEALDAFLAILMPRVPNGRVIIVSRTVPTGVALQNGMRAQTRFIPADQHLMLVDYSQHDAERPLLEVRSFGSGSVRLNGVQVDNWDGHLPRALFFYIVDKGMVTRDAIFETFWSNLNVREATNVFHVTKRKINEILGINLTTYWSGYYRVSPDIDLNYDVIRFSQLVQDSEVTTNRKEAERLLHQAAELYRGEFLTTFDSNWVVNRRSELLQTYSDALSLQANIHDDTGKLKQALGFYLRALAANPQRNDLFLKIMRLYNKLGMATETIELYEQLGSMNGNGYDELPTQQIQQVVREAMLQLS